MKIKAGEISTDRMFTLTVDEEGLQHIELAMRMLDPDIRTGRVFWNEVNDFLHASKIETFEDTHYVGKD